VYREQHERKCPFCSEWMSATAPKCLNCGRLVDEIDNDEDEDTGFAVRTSLLVGVVAVVLIAATVVVLVAG